MSDVVDNRARHRFELAVDGGMAVAEYVLDAGSITFTHTVVPAALEGRGIGSRLVGAALRDVAERGLRVVPRCAFVAAYIGRHPEFADLVDGGASGSAG